MVPTCLMRLVWKEQNSHMFEDTKKSLEQLKSSFLCTLFEWVWVWGFTHYTAIFEFHNSLSFCDWLFVISWLLCVHHHEHEVSLFLNKTLWLIKKIDMKDIFSLFMIEQILQLLIIFWKFDDILYQRKPYLLHTNIYITVYD